MPPQTENSPGVEYGPQKPAWTSMYNFGGGPVAESRMEAGPLHWIPLLIPYCRDFEINAEQAKYFFTSLGLPADWKVQLQPSPRMLDASPPKSSGNKGNTATARPIVLTVKIKDRSEVRVDLKEQTVFLQIDFQRIEDSILLSGVTRSSDSFSRIFADNIDAILQKLRPRIFKEIFTAKTSPNGGTARQAELIKKEVATATFKTAVNLLTSIFWTLDMYSNLSQNEMNPMLALLIPFFNHFIYSTVELLMMSIDDNYPPQGGKKIDVLSEDYLRNPSHVYLRPHAVKHFYLPLLASVLPAHPAFIRAVPVPPSAKLH